MAKKNKNRSNDTSTMRASSNVKNRAETGDMSKNAAGSSDEIGFDQYLARLKEKPDEHSEEKLKNILAAMCEITELVGRLHQDGKTLTNPGPGTFLHRCNNGQEFRVGSMRLKYSSAQADAEEPESLSGSGNTSSFCVPEAVKGKKDVRSDVYSIGAIFFYAIVTRNGKKDDTYEDTYEAILPKLVNSSELFASSQMKSDSEMMSQICNILCKCLASDPDQRYPDCDTLKREFEKVSARLSFQYFSSVPGSVKGTAEPKMVLQKLLYDYPMYTAMQERESDLNVLVLGSGDYAASFLDICMQYGQMVGIHLHVTAASEHPQQEKQLYLNGREALPDFVDVDGSMTGKDDAASATLQFKNIGLSSSGQEAEHSGSFSESAVRGFTGNEEANQKMIRLFFEKEKSAGNTYHYIFVALGQDEVALQIARLCSDERNEIAGGRCPVAYVSETSPEDYQKDLEKQIYPVLINQDVTLESLDSDLQQKAFNTHISWMRDMNFDVAQAKKRFFEEQSAQYDRASSISFVLSIPYKLHGVGIDTDDPKEAAELFSGQVLNKKGQKFEQLVALEHRRWVLEKVTDGWKAPRKEDGTLDLASCLERRSVRNSAQKTHPCIVTSRPESPLRDWKHADWDDENGTRTRLEQLDDLDRMSVELHRLFKKEADRVKADNQYRDALRSIRSVIPEDNGPADMAYKQYCTVLEYIRIGVESYTRDFDDNEETFKNEIESLLPENVRSFIYSELTIIRNLFFPVIEYNLFRNYKANDETLVNKIPFILTYRPVDSIVMAFEDGRHSGWNNDASFSNVASLTMLAPQTVTWLYCFDRDSDVEKLEEKMRGALRYLRRRKVRCAVRFVISRKTDEIQSIEGTQNIQEAQNIPEKLNELFKKLSTEYNKENGNAWFEMEGSELLEAGSYDKVSEQFEACVRRQKDEADARGKYLVFDAGNPILPLSMKHFHFLQMLEKEMIPYFEFDWRNRKFEFDMCKGCEFLGYVENDAFLRIQDMLALKNMSYNGLQMPEFYEDYQTLWNIYVGTGSQTEYSKNIQAWIVLSNALAKSYKDDTRNCLVYFKLDCRDEGEQKDYKYYLPGFTYQTMKNVLQRLYNYEILKEAPVVELYTSDTCLCRFKASKLYESNFNSLIREPWLLMPYYNVSVLKSKVNQGCIDVRCNKLNIKDCIMPEMQEGHEMRGVIDRILSDLAEAGYIRNYTIIRKRVPVPQKNPDGTITVSHVEKDAFSFDYSSARIRDLLSKAGEILEIYAFYEAIKTGCFDDVSTGFRNISDSSGRDNETDLLVTKGFRSIYVECKSEKSTAVDEYYKLNSVAKQLGIGAKIVMLRNYHGIDDTSNPSVSKGNDLGITTISEKNAVANIGANLMSLMKYGSIPKTGQISGGE